MSFHGYVKNLSRQFELRSWERWLAKDNKEQNKAYDGLTASQRRRLDKDVPRRRKGYFAQYEDWIPEIASECLRIAKERDKHTNYGQLVVKVLPTHDLSVSTEIRDNGDQLVVIDHLVIATASMCDRAVIYGVVDTPRSPGWENIGAARMNFIGCFFHLLTGLDRGFFKIGKLLPRAGSMRCRYKVDDDKEELADSFVRAQLAFLIFHELAHCQLESKRERIFVSLKGKPSRHLLDEEIEVLADEMAFYHLQTYITLHGARAGDKSRLAIIEEAKMAPCLLMDYLCIYEACLTLIGSRPGHSSNHNRGASSSLIFWRKDRLIQVAKKAIGKKQMRLYSLYSERILAPGRHAIGYLCELHNAAQGRSSPKTNETREKKSPLCSLKSRVQTTGKGASNKGRRRSPSQKRGDRPDR